MLQIIFKLIIGGYMITTNRLAAALIAAISAMLFLSLGISCKQDVNIYDDDDINNIANG